MALTFHFQKLGFCGSQMPVFSQEWHQVDTGDGYRQANNPLLTLNIHDGPKIITDLED